MAVVEFTPDCKNLDMRFTNESARRRARDFGADILETLGRDS